MTTETGPRRTRQATVSRRIAATAVTSLAVAASALSMASAPAQAMSLDGPNFTFNDAAISAVIGTQGANAVTFPLLVTNASNAVNYLRQETVLDPDHFTVVRRTVEIGRSTSKDAGCLYISSEPTTWKFTQESPTAGQPNPLTAWKPAKLAEVQATSGVVELKLGTGYFKAGDWLCVRQSLLGEHEFLGRKTNYTINYTPVKAQIKAPASLTALTTGLTSREDLLQTALDLTASQTATNQQVITAAQQVAQLQADAQAAAQQAQAQQEATAQAEAERIAAAAAAAQADLMAKAEAAPLDLSGVATTAGAVGQAAGINLVQAPIAGTKGVGSVNGVTLRMRSAKQAAPGHTMRVKVTVAPKSLIGVLRLALVRPKADGSVVKVSSATVAVQNGVGSGKLKVKKATPKGRYQVVASFIAANADTKGVSALRAVRVR